MCQEFWPTLFKFAGAHTHALLTGRPGATAALERALSVPTGAFPWRPPRTRTPAGSKLGRTPARRERTGGGGGQRGPLPGRALLTCQARRHGCGQQQQQQRQRRQGRQRGQPEEAPVQAAEGHRSAAATSARLDQAAGSGSCWKNGSWAGSVAPRLRIGASLIFLFH